MSNTQILGPRRAAAYVKAARDGGLTWRSAPAAGCEPVSVGGVRGEPGDVLGAEAGPGDDGDLVTLRRQQSGEVPADLSGADDDALATVDEVGGFSMFQRAKIHFVDVDAVD